MPSNLRYHYQHEYIFPSLFEVLADNFSVEKNSIDFEMAQPKLHELCNEFQKQGIDEKVIIVSGLCAAAEVKKMHFGLGELKPEDFNVAA